MHLQARRRRYFENTQDEKKRRVRDGHMKKSKYGPPTDTFTRVTCSICACLKGVDCA